MSNLNAMHVVHVVVLTATTVLVTSASLDIDNVGLALSHKEGCRQVEL